MTSQPARSIVPDVVGADGVAFPQLGFGVWQLSDEEAEGAVRTALRAGFRHIDTAAAYENEAGVGRAIRASGLDRAEVFVVSKVRNGEQGYDSTIAACHDSVERLGIGAIDLYLIHWAVPVFGKYVDTWRALVALRDEGLVRSIGVSNFEPAHLDAIVAATGVTPVLNQIELHPYLQQPVLRSYHAAHGVITEAWSPLGQGQGVLSDPVLVRIAEKHGASTAQVALAWQLALGHVVLTRSVRPERVGENRASAGLVLDPDDLAAIGRLDRAERYGKDPVTTDHTQMP